MFLVFCSDADGCPLRSGDRKADGFLQHFLLIYVRVKCLLAYIVLQATTVHVCYLDLSRILHDLIFRDTSQSLCSRAWALQHRHAFWRAWVLVFGRRHCERSHRYYHG